MVKQEFLKAVSYVTDASGQRTAVVIDIDVWNDLLAQLDTDSLRILPTPMRGTSPEETLLFKGLIEKDDLELMSQAIEAS